MAGCKDYQTLTRVERGHWALTGWKGIEVAPSRSNHWFVPDAPRVEGAFLTASVSTSKTFSSWNRNQLATRLVCCQSSKIFFYPMISYIHDDFNVPSFSILLGRGIIWSQWTSTNLAGVSWFNQPPSILGNMFQLFHWFHLVSSWIFTQIMFQNMAKLVLRIFPQFCRAPMWGPQTVPRSRRRTPCCGVPWMWLRLK